MLGTDNLKINNIIPTDKVKQNSNQRCYDCKLSIIGSISDEKYELIDGTNFDDLSQYRPGLKALKQKNVKSYHRKNRGL